MSSTAGCGLGSTAAFTGLGEIFTAAEAVAGALVAELVAELAEEEIPEPAPMGTAVRAGFCNDGVPPSAEACGVAAFGFASAPVVFDGAAPGAIVVGATIL